MNIFELKKLFIEQSKHSGYQALSSKLLQFIDIDKKYIKSRYERERLKYILENIDIENKTVLDIGGNTGFFTFELIDNGAKKVCYYEGNKTHAKFVDGAADIIGIRNKIEINNEYFTFNEKLNDKYDLLILLNVSHHIGDDYGDKKISIEKAKETILNQLNYLSTIAETMVFQMGFNWKGNRELGLFQGGTKKEMIDFIKEGTSGYWRIYKIGIAESINEVIEYHDLDDKNINRWDSMGEFLNRPIFIMKSLRFNP